MTTGTEQEQPFHINCDAEGTGSSFTVQSNLILTGIDPGKVVLGSSEYNRMILQMAVGGQANARKAFDQIMFDVSIYGSQLDNFSSANVASFNALVSSIVEQIGYVDKEMHFARIELNRAPKDLNQMLSLSATKQWILLAPAQAAYHMNGKDGEYNLKFVSADGHFEAVYNKEGKLVTSPDNMGTYNFFGPSNTKGHYNYDVAPYYRWGNTQSQGIDRREFLGGLIEQGKAGYNLAKFSDNYDAVENYLKYNYQFSK